MSDEDEIDASDWLSGQFDPTGQVPRQQEPAQPTSRLPQPPPVQPPAGQPPAAQPPANQPPFADAPAPNTQGGFNWGLRTGSAEGTAGVPTARPAADPFPPAPQAPAPQAPPPVAPVFPPAPAYEAPTYQSPPPEAFPPQYTAPTTPYVPPVYDPAPTQPPTEAYQPPQAPPAATAPFSWEDFAATQAPTGQPPAQQQQPPVPSPLQPSYPGEQPTEAYTVQPWQPTGPATNLPPVYPPTYPAAGAPADVQPHEPTSALDALFGDQQFQEYEEVGVLKTIQTIPGSDAANDEPKPPREPLPRQQRLLMIVAGALVGVLALVGLFFVGRNIGAAQAAPQPTSASSAPTGAPTSAGTGGPAAPGPQQWSALQGGECIQPFTSPWVSTFTVVDCSADHQGEMVFKGTLPDVAGAPYPNGATFATELTPLCSAATAINYTAASAITDLQISFSYPANADEWGNGDRTYYCFVNRSSSGNLPGDLAVKAAQ